MTLPGYIVRTKIFMRCSSRQWSPLRIEEHIYLERAALAPRGDVREGIAGDVHVAAEEKKTASTWRGIRRSMNRSMNQLTAVRPPCF